MLKKEFTYKDIADGSEKTETVYFHLHEADLAKLQLSVKDGMEGVVRQLVETEDITGIIAIFDDMISRSVGYRNDRGKFVRTKQFAEEFMSSEQYSDLFIEMLGSPEKQIEFIKGILPADIGEKVGNQMVLDLELPQGDTVVKDTRKLEEYTQDELVEMPEDQFNDLVGGAKLHQLPKEVLVARMMRSERDKAAAKQ
jgi:hypothetical protein